MSGQFINRKSWLKKLLVEGKDDLHVVAHIVKNHSLEDNFEIIDCEGVDNVADNLIAYINKRVQVIGIVVDADEQLDSRWESLSNTLLQQGYTVPKEIDPNGTIISAVGRNPRIGIWLMPDNKQEPGMLEHFVATLIPPDDLLKPVAWEILNRLETDKLTKYKPVHASKALIHTWLAWQEDPGTPMGLAITKTYLDHNTVLCEQFAKWLNALFSV